MKKLLHLYNYGHNPFPKIGRGGLGYHLPQYKIKGKGKSTSDAPNLRDQELDLFGNPYSITDYESEGSDDEGSVHTGDLFDDYDDNINYDDINFRDDEPITIPSLYTELTIHNKYLNSKNTTKDTLKSGLKPSQYNDKTTKKELIQKLVDRANDGKHNDLLESILYASKEYDDEEEEKQESNKIKLESKKNKLSFPNGKRPKPEPKFMSKKVDYYKDITHANVKEIKIMNDIINEIIKYEKPESKLNDLFDIYNKKFDVKEKALFKASYKPKSDDKYVQRVYDDRFKKLFLFNDRLIHNGKPVFIKNRIQNVFDSGKDFEERIKRNIPLMNTVIKQIYGGDWEFNAFRPVIENKHSNFDLYITIINNKMKKNNIMNVNVELKKYDDDDDIRETIERSRNNFVSYVTTKLLDLGIFNIQDDINEIVNNEDMSEKSKKKRLEPLLKQRYDMYKHVVKNFNKNYNKDFSFKDKNFFTMKRTKIPQIRKSILDEDVPHDPDVLKNIRLMQKDKSLSKPKAVSEANQALEENSDTLFIILKNGALYAQSYKNYLLKFINDDYDPEHIANVSQIVFDQYDGPTKKALMAVYNSFGLNCHNMQIIDTSNVPYIPDAEEKAILKKAIKARKLKLKLS
jgi:hypothetical protein